jgi:hypothetical protein
MQIQRDGAAVCLLTAVNEAVMAAIAANQPVW